MSWTVFLDRDGTLVPNRHYPTNEKQLVLYPGVRDALELLHECGAKLVVISNQSAVARGLLSKERLESMDHYLRSLIDPIPLAATHYCIHHPDFGPACSCRKPQPGMLFEGLKTTRSAPGDSFVIGDSWVDMEAGRRANLRTLLVLTGFGRRDYRQVKNEGLADAIVRNLPSAVNWILKQRERS